MLISISLITYNSARYVIETLESIKNQDYSNIELIISDDCSSDNTVDICKDWLKINGNIFKRVEVIIAETNAGIVKNCNSALSKCKGDFIKFIAGDDALESDCVSTYVKYINKYPNIKVFHSKHTVYFDEFIEKNKKSVVLSKNNIISSLIKNIENQKKIIQLHNYISAPTVIISRDTLIEIGGFDCEIPMVEDWPLWLKLSSESYFIFFVDFYSCKYRVHSESISFHDTKKELFSKFYIANNEIYRKYVVPDMSLFKSLSYELSFNAKNYMFKKGYNKRNFINRFIYLLTQSLFVLINELSLKYYLTCIKIKKKSYFLRNNHN